MLLWDKWSHGHSCDHVTAEKKNVYNCIIY